jgi:hypothetical protein
VSALSEALGEQAAPITFSHGGEDYAVTPVTQLVKTKVERWLRGLAYADLYASRQDMPPEQYEHALALLARQRSMFAYLGPLYWDTVATDEGQVGLIAILFQTTPEKARKLREERAADVDALVSETTLASMPRAMAAEMRRRLAEARAGGKPGAGEHADPTPPA